MGYLHEKAKQDEEEHRKEEAETARKMRQDHQVPQWLVSQQGLVRIRQPKEFCEQMAPKTMIFGFICAGYGLYELAVEAFLMAKAIGIAVFVVGIVWFLTQLSKAKKKYM